MPDLSCLTWGIAAQTIIFGVTVGAGLAVTLLLIACFLYWLRGEE